MKNYYLITLFFLLALTNLQAQFKFDIQNASATYVTGINDTSSIVGYCTLDGATCGFYFNGVDTLIIKPADINGAVAVWLGGINNHELAAGHYSDGTNIKPFMFNPSNGNVTFPYSNVLPISSNLKVHGINDNNIICGDYANGLDRKIWMEGPSLAFGAYQYYTTSGGFTKYPTYGGYGISNDNRVTGWYIDGTFRKPFIYDMGINEFKPMDFGNVKMQTYGMNRNNAIVVDQNINGKTRGFKMFSNSAGEFEFAGKTEIIIAGATELHPLGINKHGHACGWYLDEDGKARGFFERKYDIGFRPDPNAFMQDNTSDDWWPTSEWQNIDYRYDPNRGPGTPFPFHPGNTNLANSLFPSWPLWLKTFGAENCYVTSPLGNTYLLPAAYFKWEAISGKHEGSCFGLSSIAITSWDSLELAHNRFPDVNFNKKLSFVFMSDELREAVNIMQTSQFAQVALNQMSKWRALPPEEVLAGVKAALADTNAAHPVIGIHHGEGDQLFEHALIPYKIVPIQEGGQYREEIYCYDPNKPMNNGTGIIASVNTFSKVEWKYQKSESAEISSSAIGSLSLFFVQDLFKKDISQFFTSPEPVSSTRSFGNEMLNAVAEGNDFRIGESGNYAGPWEGALLQSLTSARSFAPLTGAAHKPRHYYLDKSGNYSYELKRKTAGNQMFYLFRDGLVQKFQRLNALSNEIDLFESTGNTLIYNNNSSNNRIIELTTVIEDTLTHESLTFIIDSLHVSPGAIITSKPNDDHSYTISNSTNTGYYNLRIRSLAQNKLKTFTHDSIPFGPNVSHTIRLNPENPDFDVMIIVDLGNDGSIDDTLFKANQSVIQMQLSKKVLNFSPEAGNDTIAVENTGSGLLNWTVAQKPEWVTIVSGNTGEGEGQIILTYTASGNTIRAGFIVVDSNQEGHSLDTIQVNQGGLLKIEKPSDTAPALLLFPNPATNQLQLYLQNKVHGNYTIEIFDVSGKQVLNTLSNHPAHSLDISTLNSGLYLLKVQLGNYSLQKRFVKH
ncbi:MAG: T9SS type A sorting domain-containing protein [Bacteroidia bacterium]|nr:T9SS type A sorting domain-containing protein [Bacteroidia bacterium]